MYPVCVILCYIVRAVYFMCEYGYCTECQAQSQTSQLTQQCCFSEGFMLLV